MQDNNIQYVFVIEEFIKSKFVFSYYRDKLGTLQKKVWARAIMKSGNFGFKRNEKATDPQLCAYMKHSQQFRRDKILAQCCGAGASLNYRIWISNLTPRSSNLLRVRLQGLCRRKTAPILLIWATFFTRKRVSVYFFYVSILLGTTSSRKFGFELLSKPYFWYWEGGGGWFYPAFLRIIHKPDFQN